MLNKNIQFTESYIQNLINEFKKGNKKSFGLLWEKVEPEVCKLLGRNFDAPTAEDLASEICYKLYNGGLEKYEPKKGIAFSSWLAGVVHNHKINALKRKKTATFSDLSKDADEDITESISPYNKSPLRFLVEKEDAGIRAEALKILPELMEKLTRKERIVLTENIYNGRTYKEIARSFNDKENQAPKYKMVRRRALKKLLALFRARGIKYFPALKR